MYVFSSVRKQGRKFIAEFCDQIVGKWLTGILFFKVKVKFASENLVKWHG